MSLGQFDEKCPNSPNYSPRHRLPSVELEGGLKDISPVLPPATYELRIETNVAWKNDFKATSDVHGARKPKHLYQNLYRNINLLDYTVSTHKETTTMYGVLVKANVAPSETVCFPFPWSYT